MPGDLIGTYLADLRRLLPAGLVEEIAGGLADAREHYLALGLSEQDAASAWPPPPRSGWSHWT